MRPTDKSRAPDGSPPGHQEELQVKRLLTAAIAAASLVLAAGQVRAQDPASYKIGAFLAMTGGGSYTGTVMSRGALLAVEEINAKGGVEGKKLELFIEDHKSGDANAAVAGFNRLLSLHGTPAMLASYTATTLAVAPIADEKQIFMVNGGGTSLTLVGASKYIVHTRTLGPDLGVAAVKRAKERGFKKMAIIVWKNDAGDSIRTQALKVWKELGGEVVADETVDPQGTNLDTQVAKMKAARPDFIMSGLFRPQVSIMVKRAREFGMTQPVIGIEFTPDDIKVAGKAAEGLEYMNDYFFPSKESPWAQQFWDAYKAKYKDDPDYYAANYYEAVYMIAELIKRAKAKGGDYWNGARLMDALKSNPEVDSVYGGKMTFQPNGVALKKAGLFEIKEGEGKFVRFVDTRN
jgi:branched-chain amino acid transport system substrate-binding protein